MGDQIQEVMSLTHEIGYLKGKIEEMNSKLDVHRNRDDEMLKKLDTFNERMERIEETFIVSRRIYKFFRVTSLIILAIVTLKFGDIKTILRIGVTGQ